MVKVKICGITTVEDALACVESGADALGFVFYPKSKRAVTPQVVRKITQNLPPFVSKVGVFVNGDPRDILEIMSYANLDYAQLHGDETPEMCEYVGASRVIKAFRLKDDSSVQEVKNYLKVVRAILVDSYSEVSYGGTGRRADINLILKVKEIASGVPLIVSGGLNPENVATVIREVEPYAVDVSSGVEKSPGVKDWEKVKEFVRRAKTL
jgi:phosphoribosylanthranilate isomerase